MTKECPRRIPKRAANSYRYKSRDSLDRIRNISYVLLLTESLPARRLPGPGEESPRCLTTSLTTTLARAQGAGEISLFLSPATP